MKYGGLTLALLMITGLAFIISCGDDNPVGPGTGFDCPVYFHGTLMNGENPMYYRYFPSSGRLDSFFLPFEPTHRMTVSVTGKELWVADGSTTKIVNLHTKKVAAELPYNGNVLAFSPDGRLAAFQATNLSIIRTDDHSMVYNEQVWLEDGMFSVDSKRFYALARPDSGYMVDLKHGNRVIKKGFGVTNLYAGAISRDETKWFLIMGVDYEWSFFLVYDLIADSIIFSHPFCPNPVRLAVSPDGRYVYLTAGGSIIFTMCQPSFSFAIYDVATNDVTSEVQAPVSIPNFHGSFLPLDYFVVTADNRYLIGSWFNEPQHIVTYDLQKMDTARILYMNDKDAYNFTTPVSIIEGRREPCDDLFFGEGSP